MEDAIEFAECIISDIRSNRPFSRILFLVESRDAAIRAECAERAVGWVDNHARPINDDSFSRQEYDDLRAAIVGEEGGENAKEGGL